jgi:hypothetical protein
MLLAVGETHGLEFLHFSRRAGRGESAIREFEIGNLKFRLSYR